VAIEKQEVGVEVIFVYNLKCTKNTNGSRTDRA